MSTVSGGGPSDGSGSLSNDDGDELPDDKSVSSGDGLSGDDESLLMSDVLCSSKEIPGITPTLAVQF